MTTESVLLSITFIIVLGISAQWLSWIIRIPSILFLIVLGVLVGPVLGLVHPQELFGDLLLPFVSLSVAIVLFEGGLSLRFKDVREVGVVIISLVTVGAIVTFASTYWLLHGFLQFSVGYSLLQSAILVVTGPTVIIPMLNQLNATEPCKSILRWEGIVIDPIGAMAAVLIYESLIQSSTTTAIETLAFGVVNTIIVGSAIGIATAYILLHLIRRFWISESLHNPVVLMFLFIAFALSNYFQHEAGLVCVTIMGIVLANQKETQLRHVVDFKENLRIILIAFLFITLAANIDLTALIDMLDESIIVLVFLIVIARPLSVFIATAFSRLSFKEKVFLSSLAPRGIVAAAISALFGIRLYQAGYDDAIEIAPVTFFVIAGTVIFYSIFSPWVAKKLGISSIPNQGVLFIGANPITRSIAETLQEEKIPVQLVDTNYWKISEAKDFSVPTYFGNFLTFETDDPKAMEKIGHVFAMTESDDINSLAIIHFNQYFDLAYLYQLPNRSEKIPDHLQGRQLFGKEYDFNTLFDLLQNGYEIKSTNLTSDFTVQDWKQTYSSKGIPLILIRNTGYLVPITVKYPLAKNAEGKLIFLSKMEH